MSSDLYVLFAGALPTNARLEETMAALGFPITFPDPDISLEKHEGGFMPMLFPGEKKTGVEIDIYDRPGVVEELGLGSRVESHFDRVVYFRWGIDMMEGIVATCVAAALAQLSGGIVYEPASDDWFPQDEAIAMARSGFTHALKS